jgi:hypothetical protein
MRSWAWAGVVVAVAIGCSGALSSPAAGGKCAAAGGACASSGNTCHGGVCEPVCTKQAPSGAQDCSGSTVCCLSLTDAGAPDSSVQDGPIYVDGPSPDSGQCVREDGTCVFCNDQRWHCGANNWPPCPTGPYPTGVAADKNCTGYELGGNDCFMCASDGGGDDWHCMGVMPGYGNWVLTPYLCSP